MFGEVDGAYCPGKYDVAARGRKIAGTAGFVRTFGKMKGTVVHASLRLGKGSPDLRAIQDFEQAIGLTDVYRQDRMTTLREEMGHASSLRPDELLAI